MMMRFCFAVWFVAIAAAALTCDRAFSPAPRSSSLQLEAKIPLGDVKGRIDHMAVDLPRRRLFVAELGNDTVLQAHPESFQLARSDRRIFVNVPKAREIAVVDRFASKQTASWPINNGSNFPMALDESSGRVFVASRNPPQLSVLSARDGSVIAAVGACGDTDDLFFDAKRQRI